MLIRLVLMLAIGGIALLLLRGNRGGRHLAIRRLLLLAFVLGAGVSLLVPSLWTTAAQLLGVGRGTDLLLYATIVAFLGYVASSYSRFTHQQRMITELSRRLALYTAPDPRPGGVDAMTALDEAVLELPLPRVVVEPPHPRGATRR